MPRSAVIAVGVAAIAIGLSACGGAGSTTTSSSAVRTPAAASRGTAATGAPHTRPSTTAGGSNTAAMPKATKKALAKMAAVGSGSACKSADQTLAVGRTTAARFSICRTANGGTYYRGLTPANGASVEVNNVIRTSSGWLVAAPDGTTYAISRTSMVITLTTGARVTSRMISYQGPGDRPVATATPIRRAANGFALGGPPTPSLPSDYSHPSHAECLKYLSEVRAWSNYQNQHRPAGSTNDLPMSGDVQYLGTVCHLNYY